MRFWFGCGNLMWCGCTHVELLPPAGLCSGTQSSGLAGLFAHFLALGDGDQDTARAIDLPTWIVVAMHVSGNRPQQHPELDIGIQSEPAISDPAPMFHLQK